MVVVEIVVAVVAATVAAEISVRAGNLKVAVRGFI
jgi:hypothetical protein